MSDSQMAFDGTHQELLHPDLQLMRDKIAHGINVVLTLEIDERDDLINTLADLGVIVDSMEGRVDVETLFVAKDRAFMSSGGMIQVATVAKRGDT